MDINLIQPFQRNAKKHPAKQVKQIANSIKEFGFNQPIVLDKNNVVIVGHGRLEAAKLLGLKEVPTITVDLTEEQAKAYRLADNKLNESEWDMGLVIEELKELSQEMLDLTGFDKDIINEYDKQNLKNALQNDFIIPPFSVFDTKQDYWQNRKRLWIKYLGDSGEGRDDDLIGIGLKKLGEKYTPGLTGTSIFDPVLAEICYRWFNVNKGTILDPFAGGNVRGLVAETLGYKYTGVDLSEKQKKSNEVRAKELELKPRYIKGNSLDLDILVSEEYDLIFTCPPYYNLEIYSEDKEDLSNKGNYEDFINDYEQIILKSVEHLKDDRFAIFVIGDIRDEKGFYRGLVEDTIRAFDKAGVKLYNQIILVNALGTAPIRARTPFTINRKAVKVHQNVLVFHKGDIVKQHEDILIFYKGDIKKIQSNYGTVLTELDI